MKKIVFFLLIFLCQLAKSQSSQGFNYQAIIRDNAGKPKVNTTVNLKLSILEGNVNGSVLYSENHNVQSNSVGLVNVVIGKGSVLSGNFSNIIWKNSKFLQVVADNVLMGTSELQSVPFAKYAETTNLSAGNGIVISGNTITNTGDLSNSNEIQTLSLSGSTLSLSNGGGSVTLPTASNSNSFQGKVSFFNTDKSKESFFYDGNQENIALNVGKTFGKIHLNDKINGDVEIGSTAAASGVFRVFTSSQFNYIASFNSAAYFNLAPTFYKGADFRGEFAAFYDKMPRMYKRLQIYSKTAKLSSDEGGIEFINDGFNSGFIGMRDNNEMGIYGYGINDWIMRFNINLGTICAKSTITLCSDERLKRDFSPLSASLSNLNRINGYHYFWKNEKQTALQIGFKAQDIQQVFPELVETDAAGMLSVNYIGFVPHLVEAVKALSAENQLLKQENEQMRASLESLSKRLDALEKEQVLVKK